MPNPSNYFNPFAPCTQLAGLYYQPTFKKLMSKTEKVNTAFTRKFLKEYLMSFLMVCRLIDFALAALKFLMFKVCEITGISKIKFFNFSSTERVKQNQINKSINQ